MPRKILGCLLGLALSVSANAGAQEARDSGTELARGIRQVETGDFRKALDTLDRAVEALGGQPERAAERSRAHLYIGIAWLALNRAAAARSAFQRALGDVPDLRLSPEEFPPRVIAAFEEARAAFLAGEEPAMIENTVANQPEPRPGAADLGALPPLRKWSVSWTTGSRASGGPSSALEAVMVAAGLNSPLASFFGGVIQHPWSTQPGFSWFGSTLSIGYAIRPSLQVRIQGRSSADFGQIYGYKGPLECCPSEVPLAFFDARASAKSFALVAAFTRAGFRIGGGPSINWLRLESSGTGSNAFSVSKATRPGLVLDVGLTVPEKSLLFLDLSFQYRYAGSMSFGPMDLIDEGRLVTTVPRARLPFSCPVLGFGLGFRL